MAVVIIKLIILVIFTRGDGFDMPRIGLDQNLILQAAAELADKEGVEEVTLASLAKKLGIRTPSLYNHVDGLDGLRNKLALYGIERLESVILQAAVGRSGDEAVHAIGKAYMEFARTRPGVYAATQRAPRPQDTEARLASGRVVDLVVRVLNPYRLEGDAAIHAVRGLRSILHGFASLEQQGGFGIPLNLDVSLRLTLDAFLAGLPVIKQSAVADEKS
jgi:AcrR family transcriptional regulator